MSKNLLKVPQRPNDEVGGYLEASVGDYAMSRLQGVFNTPVGDQARLRLGFDRQGYMTNQSPIGPRDFNDVDYLARAPASSSISPPRSKTIRS